MSKTYKVFTRTWWKQGPKGLEPNAGQKKILRRGLTYEEARQLCADINANIKPSKPGRKAEFEEE